MKSNISTHNRKIKGKSIRVKIDDDWWTYTDEVYILVDFLVERAEINNSWSSIRNIIEKPWHYTNEYKAIKYMKDNFSEEEISDIFVELNAQGMIFGDREFYNQLYNGDYDYLKRE